MEASLKLVDFHSVNNAFYMAKTEMETIHDIDKDAVEPSINKIVFYFAPGDGWAPEHQYEDLRAQFPAARCVAGGRQRQEGTHGVTWVRCCIAGHSCAPTTRDMPSAHTTMSLSSLPTKPIIGCSTHTLPSRNRRRLKEHNYELT